MSMDRTESNVHLQSPSQAKIALFRSLFRGRDDVYARRFESRKTGKSGYAPACANEWIRGVCERPRIKCGDCSKRRFLAVTDDVIRCHLSGRDDAGQPFVAGVYPMLRDEACFFLAVEANLASGGVRACVVTNAWKSHPDQLRQIKPKPLRRVWHHRRV